MDTIEQPTQDGQPVRSEPESVRSAKHSRRAFLFKLSLLVNGAVGAVLTVPIVGYLLGPALKKGSSYNSWVTLGPLSDFPEGETRLVNYRNPVTTLWDGQTGDIPCWVPTGFRHDVPGVCNQLCASGLSGALVCAGQALPVPVPWGGLLR